MQLDVEYRRRPSALAYMARALHRAPELRLGGGFPALRLTWRGIRRDDRALADFAVLTGLEVERALPLLYPHVIGFRLQMALLTHPAFPLPIWRALQVRNHLLQWRALAADQPFDLAVSVGAQRVLEKGLEIDLHSSVSVAGSIAWESIVTYYYRGRFGTAGPASALARSPDAGNQEVVRWRTTSGSGIRFGRLTGDYNGIHLSSAYARAFGFPCAFHHPQLVLGQCMARLQMAESGQPQRLDAWLKGPVCHGAEVVLRARRESEATTFALFADGDSRPAICGRWSMAAGSERLTQG